MLYVNSRPGVKLELLADVDVEPKSVMPARRPMFMVLEDEDETE
jgi:hypothetical protein